MPDSSEEMTAILDAIDGHLADGRTVYVHCWGGVGRTGTVIGCWLARHGRQGEPALARLRELWRECPKSATRKSPETEEQERYVLEWCGPTAIKGRVSTWECREGDDTEVDAIEVLEPNRQARSRTRRGLCGRTASKPQARITDSGTPGACSFTRVSSPRP